LNLLKACSHVIVAPAKAGGPVALPIDVTIKNQRRWIPAFAGMTVFLTAPAHPYLSAYGDKHGCQGSHGAAVSNPKLQFEQSYHPI
jgi:hypothetical protein